MDHTHQHQPEDHTELTAHEQDQAGYGFDRGAALHDQRRDHEEHASSAGYGKRVDRVPHTAGRAEPDTSEDSAADPPHPAHDRDVESTDGDSASDPRCRFPGRAS